jgi:hypothetical protein
VKLLLYTLTGNTRYSTAINQQLQVMFRHEGGLKKPDSIKEQSMDFPIEADKVPFVFKKRSVG